MSTRPERLALAGLFDAELAGCVGSPDDGSDRAAPGPALDTPEEIPLALVRGVGRSAATCSASATTRTCASRRTASPSRSR